MNVTRVWRYTLPSAWEAMAGVYLELLNLEASLGHIARLHPQTVVKTKLQHQKEGPHINN